MDGKREMLRHALATIAYRGGKAMRDAPAGFGEFAAGASARTPVQIVAHLGDLFDWSARLIAGDPQWTSATPLAWDQETARFLGSLRRLDGELASRPSLACRDEQLLQGPIADALTHVGQLMMLRRLAGAPVKSENYFKAPITAG